MKLKNILNQLNKEMSDSEIGRHIGAPQSTVNRLRNGVHKTTNYERWLAILELAESRGIKL